MFSWCKCLIVSLVFYLFSKILNASVTRMGTGTRMRTRTWNTEVSRIALCTSCSRTENKKSFGSVFYFFCKAIVYTETLCGGLQKLVITKLNTGKQNVNLVNTYKTILVAFYNPYKFQKTF